MPSVQTRALTLSVSSPTQATGGRKMISFDGVEMATVPDMVHPGLVVPIELTNGCSEDGVVIDSDDVHLTNIIRKHYLEHFGHRDLNGIVSGYSDDNAIVIHKVTDNDGDKTEHTTKYHGLDEIREYYETVIFKNHPAGESTFRLKRIECEKNSHHAIVTWSAKTPTFAIDQGTDTFVFNSSGKICKHHFSCETHEREDIGTTGVVQRRRRSSSASSTNDYGGFFTQGGEWTE
jgi:hypothetical protein